MRLHFGSAAEHKYHGRRIGRDEARGRGLEIEDMETSQDLQDAVLTAYHVMTILFDNGPQVKLLTTDSGALWIKNVQFGQMPGGTQPGDVITIKGKGVTRIDGRGKGALHVIVQVDVPKRINQRVRTLLLELQKELQSQTEKRAASGRE